MKTLLMLNSHQETASGSFLAAPIRAHPPCLWQLAPHQARNQRVTGFLPVGARIAQQ